MSHESVSDAGRSTHFLFFFNEKKKENEQEMSGKNETRNKKQEKWNMIQGTGLLYYVVELLVALPFPLCPGPLIEPLFVIIYPCGVYKLSFLSPVIIIFPICNLLFSLKVTKGAISYLKKNISNRKKITQHPSQQSHQKVKHQICRSSSADLTHRIIGSTSSATLVTLYPRR